jgi:hypothetical protein
MNWTEISPDDRNSYKLFLNNENSCSMINYKHSFRLCFASPLYASLIRSTGLMVSPRLASAMARLMSLKS